MGILNLLDMSIYAGLVKDYLDNKRRGIADLPELSSTLWREVKDAQVIRFRGGKGSDLESIYLPRADDIKIDGGRGRGRACWTGRGGRGRGWSSTQEKEPSKSMETAMVSIPSSITPDSVLDLRKERPPCLFLYRCKGTLHGNRT